MSIFFYHACVSLWRVTFDRSCLRAKKNFTRRRYAGTLGCRRSHTAAVAHMLATGRPGMWHMLFEDDILFPPTLFGEALPATLYMGPSGVPCKFFLHCFLCRYLCPSYPFCIFVFFYFFCCFFLLSPLFSCFFLKKALRLTQSDCRLDSFLGKRDNSVR